MTEKKEVIAKGRFHWARLVVTLKNGNALYEDRSDPYWWDNLPKKWITSLSVQITNPHSLKHTLKASKSHNYQFFHYKKRELIWGGVGKQSRDVAFAIGMVTNKNGDCQVLEVKPGGSVFAFKSNVIEAGRNLNLHGIKLEEIY